MGEVSRRRNSEERSIDSAPVTPAQLGALIKRIHDGTINNNSAKQVFEALWTGEGADVDTIIDAKDLKQSNDTGEIERILDRCSPPTPSRSRNSAPARRRRSTRWSARATKAAKGKANPATVNELLKKKLGA